MCLQSLRSQCGLTAVKQFNSAVCQSEVEVCNTDAACIEAIDAYYLALYRIADCFPTRLAGCNLPTLDAAAPASATDLVACANQADNVPGLADLVYASRRAPPPPLAVANCTASTLDYPQDCSSAGSCFASNSSCGFELGGPQRFGEHRAFRCTSQCFVDYGSWDLGCDASVIFPGDELAAQHQRADALSLSHECYAAGFLSQLGVAGSPCQAIASSCAM